MAAIRLSFVRCWTHEEGLEQYIQRENLSDLKVDYDALRHLINNGINRRLIIIASMVVSLDLAWKSARNSGDLAGPNQYVNLVFLKNKVA